MHSLEQPIRFGDPDFINALQPRETPDSLDIVAPKGWRSSSRSAGGGEGATRKPKPHAETGWVPGHLHDPVEAALVEEISLTTLLQDIYLKYVNGWVSLTDRVGEPASAGEHLDKEVPARN